jgi:hypothetical protein
LIHQSPSPVIAWRHALVESDLDRTAILVGLVLAVYMNAKGEAHPSRATIAAGAKLSVSSVDRALKRLKRAFLVRIGPNPDHRGRRCNDYVATMPDVVVTEPTSALAVANVSTGGSQRRHLLTAEIGEVNEIDILALRERWEAAHPGATYPFTPPRLRDVA